jgi:hypothetical protein
MGMFAPSEFVMFLLRRPDLNLWSPGEFEIPALKIIFSMPSYQVQLNVHVRNSALPFAPAHG